jgi:hypothetical protein
LELFCKKSYFLLDAESAGAILYLYHMKIRKKQGVFRRVHRQHGSLVITLPRQMVVDKGVEAGHYVYVEWQFDKRLICKISKAVQG